MLAPLAASIPRPNSSLFSRSTSSAVLTFLGLLMNQNFTLLLVVNVNALLTLRLASLTMNCKKGRLGKDRGEGSGVS